jgi:5-methylcytosine-specific restriction protein A
VSRAPKRCVVSACPRAAVLGGRCPGHQVSERYVAAWEGSTHSPTNTQAWRILRKKIIQRDDGICQRCGTQGATDVDHIVPRAEGGTDSEENLQLLCKPCHASKSGREGARARARKRGTDPLGW